MAFIAKIKPLDKTRRIEVAIFIMYLYDLRNLDFNSSINYLVYKTVMKSIKVGHYLFCNCRGMKDCSCCCSGC